MPQLNPAPWFAILVFSWLVFLTLIPTKVMGHIFNNEPNPLTAKKPQLSAWTWPWY
uniref:ATP synthase complex subunit 8 n=1 Tax=Ophichthus brevicaudatus TaxID=1867744 RepID=A0A5J6YDT0_9TELE|nr:ATP synthase F0 subunit 8 [Ophichthus brevicaudatus]QXF68547.1 ATP synthase F0 subunit 8 [Ophichthus brevicaudatus]